MKVCVKKVHCPGCQKLVRCREQEDGRATQVICSLCGRLLWVWNGIRWRYGGEAAAVQSKP
ncbi:MAG: hypothetical protein V1737_02025 [Chloroflexota bacterium]